MYNWPQNDPKKKEEKKDVGSETLHDLMMMDGMMEKTINQTFESQTVSKLWYVLMADGRREEGKTLILMAD